MATDNDPKKKVVLGAAGGTSGAGLLAQNETVQEAAPTAPNVTGQDTQVASKYVNPADHVAAAKNPDAAIDGIQKDGEYMAHRADDEMKRINPEYGAMRGMFEGGGPMPEFEAAKLDASTQGLIEGQDARANQDLKSMVAEQLAGTEYGKEALDRAMEGQRFSEQGLGGDTGNFLEAIQQRAGKGFEGDMASMKRKAAISAPEEKFRRMQNVMQTKNKQAFNQKMIADAEYKHKRNVQAAKNKMLGSVLGLGGMVLGGYLGGPQGAAAGSQASGLAGNQETENM